MTLWLSDPGDVAAVLRWSLALLLSGWLMVPLTTRLLPNMPAPAQVIAARILGWSVGGYAGWLLGALGIGAFHAQAGTVAVLVLVATWALTRSNAKPIAWPTIAKVEGVFWVLFALGLAARLAHPDLNGLEKPTNLSFLSSLMLAEQMPPEDAWFAGNSINYYYLGHATVAVFAQITATTADQAYQLAMASLFAMTGMAIGAVVFATLAPLGQRLAASLAALSCVAALYAGNLHSFLYSVLRTWMPATEPDFYFPNSTRFIGFDPETQDRAFTEFTSYSFRAGDMHAHVLATPLFLGGMLILLSMLRTGAAGRRVGYGPAVALAVTLGLSYGTNSWDVAILGLGALAVWIALAIRAGRSGLDRMVALAITVLAVAFATALPFAAHFRPFGDGITWAGAQSPIWQLVVVHGAALPALVALVYLAVRRRWSVPMGVAAGLGLWGLALIVLPEVIRVEDIYGQDFARANTMFKLTFRSQTILLIASAIVCGLLVVQQGRLVFTAALIVIAPVIATFTYAEHTFAVPRAGQSLDGLRHLGPRADMAEYLAFVPWLEGESLLEAPSDSFTEGAALATASGRPSVIGWTGHIQLWHGSRDAAWGRTVEITEFFETEDRAARCRIIRRYNAVFIVFTQAERTRFPDLTLAELAAFGHVAFDGEGGQLIRVTPATCTPEPAQ